MKRLPDEEVEHRLNSFLAALHSSVLEIRPLLPETTPAGRTLLQRGKHFTALLKQAPW
jgi:hypothetical protein